MVVIRWINYTMQSGNEFRVASIALKKAKECLEKNNYGLAFANFLLVFKLAPELHESMSSQFLECMNNWCATLRKEHRSEDLLQCLHEACSVLPDNAHILNTMGTELFRLGFLDEAASYFRKSLRTDSTFLLARANLQNLCSHVVERWHFRMLNDKTRNSAFKEAIDRAIRSGHVTVLDIGSGTGLLSMFAASSRAKSVYGCDMSKVMHDIATECVNYNQLVGQINLIHKKSTELSIPKDIPERVSLLVTETFDAGLLGEHIISTLTHAWQNLLINTESAKGKVIPAAAAVYVCAVESEWLRKKHRVIYPGMRYLEYGNCHFTSKACSSDSESDIEPYTSYRLCDIPGGYRFLSEIKMIENFVFDKPETVQEYSAGFTHNHMLNITSQGHLDAIVLWFDLHLDELVSLSTNPSVESCWEQAVYPVLPTSLEDVSNSLTVAQNDQLKISVHCKDNALHIKPLQLHRHGSVNCENMASTENQYLCSFSQNSVSNPLHFILTPEEISCLNNLTWNQMHCQALERVKTELKEQGSFTVLFILFDLSLLPLQALRLNADAVCVVSKNPVMNDVLTAVGGQNNLPTEKLQYLCSVDEVQGSWDVLVVDVIECSGSLQPQILEDMAIARMTCMSPRNFVIPHCINVYGVLVESDSLLKDSCVVSKVNTLDLEIGRFINDFQMTQHVDIHMSTLKYQKLSVPFKMFTFDFNEPLDENDELEMTFLHQDNTLRVTAAETGNVTAILYWYDLTLYMNLNYSTLDSTCHINQAALLQKEPCSVNAGTEIEVRTLCKNSCFDVMLT